MCCTGTARRRLQHARRGELCLHRKSSRRAARAQQAHPTGNLRPVAAHGLCLVARQWIEISCRAGRERTTILAEGTIALPVTLSGGALFAS